MITREQIDHLAEVLPRLDASSQEFARSLIRQWRLRGSLSVRQEPHIGRLIDRADAPAALRAVVESERVGVALPAEGFATLMGHMQTATARGARAAITVPVQGNRYRLATPAATSTYAGRPVLFVRRDQEYVGRIEDARFLAARGVDPLTVMPHLNTILTDPVNQLAHVGRMTGICCFCARALSDPRSVSMGYGPICADRFGLPWGGTTNERHEAFAAAADATNAAAASLRQLGAVVGATAVAARRVRAPGPVTGAASNSTSFAPDQLDDEDQQFMGGV